LTGADFRPRARRSTSTRSSTSPASRFRDTDDESAPGGYSCLLLGREAEDECERSVGAGPVLADEWLTARAEEAAEDEHDDHDIIELAGNRDEVRY
jgi:hypothetical protein